MEEQYTLIVQMQLFAPIQLRIQDSKTIQQQEKEVHMRLTFSLQRQITLHS